jgi:nicotinate phosphoribosyltransferase
VWVVRNFGVGSHISSAQPNVFTEDLQEIEGNPIAKRERIPGITENSRFKVLISLHTSLTVPVARIQ